MFDIGFAELFIVAILSLIIFGPERLPEAIKTVALWIGRFKRRYHKIRTSLEDEIGVDEIKRQLHNEEVLQQLNDINKDLDDATLRIKDADRKP